MLNARKMSAELLVGLAIVCAHAVGAGAQTAQFSASGNFGSVALGQTSSVTTLTATFSAAGTIGASQALTMGSAGLDYAVSGGTCTAGQNYAVGNSCTVTVTFTPMYAGPRNGAVVLEDQSGNSVATAYLQGIGTGPEAGFQVQQNSVRMFPGNVIFPVRGVAVDGAGDIFVGSANQGAFGETMVEVPAGCVQASCVKQLPGKYDGTWGMAVDGGGNVFVADVSQPGVITEIPASGGYTTMKTLTGNFGLVQSVAVDGSGNVFVSDFTNSAVEEMTAASGYANMTTVVNGLTSPDGIQVDGSGDVFLVDGAKVKEIVAVNGSIPASPTINVLGSGFLNPIDLVLDASGNVYVTDSNINHTGLFEILAAGGYTTVKNFAGGFTAPSGMAIDSTSNIYVVDSYADDGFGFGGYFLNILQRNQAPEIAFPNPAPPGSTEGTATDILTNLGTSALNVSALTLSSNNFAMDAATTTCTSSIVLAPGASCVLGLNFTPRAVGGSINGTLTVTDNSLNAAGSTQQVSLFGQALYTPVVTVTSAPNIALAQTLTVTVTVQAAGGNPVPTGTVQLNTGTMLTDPTPLVNGSATFMVPAATLVPGAVPPGAGVVAIVTLVADYSPDTASSAFYVGNRGLSSVTVTSTALTLPTVTVTPQLPRVASLEPLTLTATVNGGGTNPTPTGTVTMQAGGGYTSSPATLVNGSANVTIPGGSLPVGTVGVNVTYVPDAAGSNTYLPASGIDWVTVTAPPAPVSPVTPGFGSLPIGQTSAVTPVTLTFAGNTTIGSVSAMTQGAPGLDFALTPGGTCTVGASFTSGQSCTVNATFMPKSAGLRNGGIVVLDASGTLQAQSYVHGTGTGPQMIFFGEPYYGYGGEVTNYATSETLLGDGFGHPGIAVDGAGNVFVADLLNNAIREIPAGCTQDSCQKLVMGGLGGPWAVAVDGAGNLFVANIGWNLVTEIPIGCQTESCLQWIGSGFDQPYGVALDSSGNVFVADEGNGAIKEVLAAGGYSTVNTLASGLDAPWSVVVDANENLFVGEGGDQCQVFIPGVCTTINTSVVEIPAANDYSQTNVLGSGVFGKPMGLAIDGSGNVIVGDFGDACPFEFLVGNGYRGASRLCSTQFSADPESIAVDGNENLILPDVISGTVEKVGFADPPTLKFRSPALVGEVDVADGDQYFGMQNNGNAPLTFSSITISDPSFQIDATTTTCLTSKPVAPGGNCFVGVIFQPTTTGVKNATLTLTNNNLNQNQGTQSIQIEADSLPPPPTILTEPANPTGANSATFTFSDTQANVTFECSIDGLPFSACTSGISYSPVSIGQHSFQVKALDTDNFLSPASVYNWTVTGVAVPPPTITSGPGHITNATTAAFSFTDTEGGVTYLCSLDGAAFTACTSVVSYPGIGNTGTSGAINQVHTFAVEAKDGGGNISQPASYTWNFTRDGVEAAPVDFGAVPVGQTSAAQTLNFVFSVFQQIPAGGDTIAKITATTLGVTGLDYAVSDPGTCATGTAVTTAGTCSMMVTFTPSHAGQRKGAIVLTDAAGNGIGGAYLNGTGTAPQVTFTPYTPVNFTILPPQSGAAPGKDLETSVTDSVMDGAGDLYVTDDLIGSQDGTIAQSVGDVWEFPAGCTTADCIKQVASSGLAGNPLRMVVATGIALDGAGTIWSGSSELGGGDLPTVGNWTSPDCEIYSLFPASFGVFQRPAVDGWGQVFYLGDGFLTMCDQQFGKLGAAAIQGKGHLPKSPAMKAKPEAGGNTLSFDFSGTADSLAVDPQGNIWVADTGNNAVKEVLASSRFTISQVVGSGFNNPESVASDAFGNIFVNDAGNNAIKEMTASSAYTTILTVAQFNQTTGSLDTNISVDAMGNVYVPNWASSTNSLGVTVKLDFADAPGLAFPTPTKVATKDTVDGTMTATVNNSGNAPLTISGLAIQGNSFQIDSNATTCSASTTVAVGGSCTVGVFFSPDAVGAQTGTLTIADNALNANGATQTFALSGTGFITATTSTPTVTVTPAANSISTTQTLNVIVTVAGTNPTPVPTGVVTLSSGSYNSAATTLTGGTATITVPAGVLAAGSDTLIAIYAPDHAASTTYNDGAGTAIVTVTAAAKTTPTVLATPSPATVTVAQEFSVTVTVAGSASNPTPTGTVTLQSGGFSSGLVVLNNGSATIPIPARMLAAGTDTLTVNYAPDTTSAANYNNAAGSATETVQPIAKTSPTVVVKPTPNNISTKQALTVIVTLNGGLANPSPTGTVTLSGGGFMSAAITLNGGSASIPIPAGSLSLGSDTLTANYTPDAAGAETYMNATGANSVTVSSAASSSALVASATSVNVGTSVTFTATVTPSAGGTTPTGTITFMDGPTTLSSGTLNGAGIATYTTAALALGQHSITAVYGGDSNNTGSTSNSVTVTVSLAQTSTALMASATSVNAGTSVTFTATVTQNPGSAVPTGTVTFIDGSTTLGTGTLNNSGVATYTTSALALGQHSVTAVYGGDVNNAGSTSAAVTVTVAGVQVLSATLTPGTLTFTGVMGTTSAAQTATLTNTGNTALAITGISLTGTNPSDFAESNECPTSLAPQQTCAISVTFAPESAGSPTATLSVSDNATGAPQTATLTGTATPAPTFTISSPTGPQTIPAGGSATYTITVTPQNGSFNNAVMFAASGLPAGATATFQPTSVTPGGSPASSTLMIQTGTLQTAAAKVGWPLPAATLAALGLFFIPGKRRRRWITMAVLLLASFGALTAMTGCGGGFAIPKAPTQTYTVTVTATSGTTQQTTTVQLTVE